MEIGGNDHVLELSLDLMIKNAVETAVSNSWPLFVSEVDEENAFYYRDVEAQSSWKKNGRTGYNKDLTVHVVYDVPGRRVSVVTDGPRTELILEEVQRATSSKVLE